MNNPSPSSQSSDNAPAVTGMETLGIQLLLATLGMFFAAAIGFYIFRRLGDPQWPPPDAPALPWTLWLSTGLLIGSSMTVHYALHSARSGRQAALRLGLGSTLLLGLAFLACQVYSWLPLISAQIKAPANLYKLSFYILACLHGAHVIGGLLPLSVITAAAARNVYTAETHLPVKHIAMYWHFLDVAWVIIFIVLLWLG